MTPLSAWEGERQSGADLSRKFLGCYIYGGPLGTTPQVWRVDEITDFNVSVSSSPTSHISRHILESFGVAVPLPDSGVYATDKGIFFLRRLGNRQWAEGLSINTVRVMFNLSKPMNTLTFDIAQALFAKQEDITIRDALQLVAKEKRSTRVTKDFWILVERKKTPKLFFKSARIGSWVEGKFFWSPVGKILNEEVKDTLGEL